MTVFCVEIHQGNVFDTLVCLIVIQTECIPFICFHGEGIIDDTATVFNLIKKLNFAVGAFRMEETFVINDKGKNFLAVFIQQTCANRDIAGTEQVEFHNTAVLIRNTELCLRGFQTGIVDGDLFVCF